MTKLTPEEQAALIAAEADNLRAGGAVADAAAIYLWAMGVELPPAAHGFDILGPDGAPPGVLLH